MTLLGCDCDAKVCDYLADAAPRWDSIASCEAAMKSQVLTRAHLDYPLVTAECRTLAAEPDVIQASAEPALASADIETAPRRPAAAEASALTRTVAFFRQSEAGYDLVKSGVQSAVDGLASRVSAVLSGSAKLIFE